MGRVGIEPTTSRLKVEFCIPDRVGGNWTTLLKPFHSMCCSKTHPDVVRWKSETQVRLIAKNETYLRRVEQSTNLLEHSVLWQIKRYGSQHLGSVA